MMEFVNHQALESVGNGIDIVHPSRPAKHVSRRDGKSSVDNQTQDEDGGGHQSLGQSARRGGDSTEEHGHGQGRHEGKQQEDEECAWFATKTGHEIQGNVENDGISNFVRHVTQHGCDGFGERVIHGVAGLFFDNRTLGIQG